MQIRRQFSKRYINKVLVEHLKLEYPDITLDNIMWHVEPTEKPLSKISSSEDLYEINVLFFINDKEGESEI